MEELKWKVTMQTNAGKVFCIIAIGETEEQARCYIDSRYSVKILKIKKVESA